MGSDRNEISYGPNYRDSRPETDEGSDCGPLVFGLISFVLSLSTFGTKSNAGLINVSIPQILIASVIRMYSCEKNMCVKYILN
jgi:hypothetical protein